ncbi:hypothetical protein JRQ81_010875 [Phrynocephalus forsythii]|uniref:Snake toxin/toxin-like domain-containing protein n=1 Tax=Phrynocephalus forsythii TaxID=171643 RepID=A0A9Q0X7A5_9SAUR|nr:hypothetical protein JRQ81_010875 [Phrynocephalus forsythii]
MHRIIAVGFIGVFCFATSVPLNVQDDITCAACGYVTPYNFCLKRAHTCVTRKSEYCYNRMVSKGGAIICFLCKNVAEDNTCVHSENTCDSGLWQFCYTRLISKGKVMIGVDRGCSAVCRVLKKEKEDFEEKMVCCAQNLCNYHNFWTNQ